MLKEVIEEKDNVEELNDQCELLMEQTACSRVRDETIETQANYTKLLTSAQGKFFFHYVFFVKDFGVLRKTIISLTPILLTVKILGIFLIE